MGGSTVGPCTSQGMLTLEQGGGSGNKGRSGTPLVKLVHPSAWTGSVSILVHYERAPVILSRLKDARRGIERSRRDIERSRRGIERSRQPRVRTAQGLARAEGRA